MIEAFIESQAYTMPVETRHEPNILGTGGAIRNVADFWDNDPFIVINGDILSNIDLVEIYRFHTEHEDPVTMVLHDYRKYNHVWIDSNAAIKGFGHKEPCPPEQTVSGEAGQGELRKVAYTGIQVLDPSVLNHVPQGGFCNIIDVFCEMLQHQVSIRGLVVENHYWHDIGTLDGYNDASRDALARRSFEAAVPSARPTKMVWSRLKGDGSDRTWYRVSIPPTPADPNLSIIVVDHGQPPEEGVCEADAFTSIGEHLLLKGVRVPRIFAYDRSSGLVGLEDCGDTHLQQLVGRLSDDGEVEACYKRVIDTLLFMGIKGAEGFDVATTYQTPYYDRELVIERESRYFVEAFLNGYLKLAVSFESFEDEFQLLAERALEHPYAGFLHRDFQSRNILVKNGDYYFIDFQGGRLGPLQYDLASLLIDPYVALPNQLQETLLDDYVNKLAGFMDVDRDLFVNGYRCCAVNRNLQILGAFAFLSLEKGKKDFEAYIPTAISSLKAGLGNLAGGVCPTLRELVKEL
jgi:aminoglycoside/choline kinase family phosphotransferase/dTDP-glucose pyrophosphorylase